MRLSEIYEHILDDAKDAEFLPTGFPKLDAFLDGGLMKKELIVLGAPTGYGKSFIAGQILLNVAMKGFKTAYFSLEISNKMIASRFTGAETNIKPTRLSHGLLTKEELDNKQKAEAELLAYEEFLDFYDDLYLLDEIEKVIKDNEFDFVVIDFLQNVSVQNIPDEYSRLSKVSLNLQKLAKEKNLCIFALSQLSNIVAREGAGGRATEFRGSGSIAHVADIAFFLEREDYVEGSEFQPINITLKKNRRGLSGSQFTFLFKHPGGKIYET